MLNSRRIIRRASKSLFGRPLIMNVHRSILVEAMVAEALPGWRWCSNDYAPWDFIRDDQLKLEVKQSSMLQSWSREAPSENPSPPSWDIAARTRYWTPETGLVQWAGRCAQIYVLGLHPLRDETADHRLPEQWRFFVLAERDLPDARKLSFVRARAMQAEGLAAFVGTEGLAEAVEAAARRILPLLPPGWETPGWSPAAPAPAEAHPL